MPAQLSALVLGTGGGADHVYRGACSSSLLLLRDATPLLLVDLGLGVTRALQQHDQPIPDTVLVTHNHSDHAGELPVVLRVEHARGRRLRVIAEREVGRRLRDHRLAEHAQQCTADDLADWRLVDAGEPVELGHGYRLELVPGTHSERSVGCVLRHGTQAVFGYSGDSGVDEHLYGRLTAAPVVVFDGRPGGSAWHAGFEELEPWLGDGRWVIGHGVDDPGLYPLPLLAPGQRLDLGAWP